MTKEYKTFITFLDKHIQSENELDMVIYNIGTVQRIAEQFAQFYNQQIKDKQDYDLIDLEIEFENNLSSMIEAMNLDDEERIDAEIIEADFIEKE